MFYKPGIQTNIGYTNETQNGYGSGLIQIKSLNSHLSNNHLK